jgi:hypothetical protein
MRILALLLALVLTGCVGPRIDWTARLGNYTYDQAVAEFGTPGKLTRLSTGATVAEWLIRRGQVVVQPAGEPVAPGVYTPLYTQRYLPGTYLRLTFGPDGKLTAQKDIRK